MCAITTTTTTTQQVYDYDRLMPTDDLLGTAEVYFTHESIENDLDTGGQKVSSSSNNCCRDPAE